MPRGHKKVDTLRAAELKQGGATYKEIAAIQGVSPQAIQQSIKDLLPTEDTETYKKNRPDIFAGLQSKLLLNLDQTDLKALMAKQPSAMALWFNSLFNAERLERGQSTQNVETIVQSLSSDRESLLKEIEILKGGK